MSGMVLGLISELGIY